MESLHPDFTSALPQPNVYGAAAPAHEVPMGPLSAAEVAEMRMDESSAGVLAYLKTMMESGKNSKFWHELAPWHVDDVAIGTYDKEAIIGDLTRRFERVTCHVNGGMFLGFDITYDKETNLLVMSLETYLDRVVEAMLAKDPEDVTLRSNVGILNWATSTIFGTYVKEARNLASRCNLEEQGDLETSIALIHEIHSKRKQGIHFRKLDDGMHIFEPRTSRKDGILDVSDPHRSRPVGDSDVIVSKADIEVGDDHYNIYEDDPLLKNDFDEENMPTTQMFKASTCTDASCAPRGEDGRSDIMFIVFVNGAPVDWNPITLKGVADSASTAEYCGSSVGCKKGGAVLILLRFAGVALDDHDQYIDSTSGKQIAENPKKLGSTRNLGIRWHLIRHAIHALNLKLKYCITEDYVPDFGTKRLARKKLERFAIIFFNCLHLDWRGNWDDLLHICEAGVFPEWD